MVWITWRQHRSQVLITAGLLATFGLVLLIHGLRNADLAETLRSDPESLERVLGGRFTTIGNVIAWLPLAPALIGLFWGAPVLAKEFERGTHRLVWTQSVSQRRWLAVKLGVLSAVVVLAGLAFGAMVGAWLATFEGTNGTERFGRVTLFVVTGVVPAAWWLFAFMAGVAAGAVLRRTLPAIAVTLVVVVVPIVYMFAANVRADYATPERVVDPTNTTALPHDALLARTEMIDGDGRVVTADELRAGCAPTAPCMIERPDIREVIYYHPADRYWRFQWTEAAILVTASLALGALTIRRTARSRI
jgi:hypothetical protein